MANDSKKVTFHRAGYAGAVVVKVGGQFNDYIDRSMDNPKLWQWGGRYFGSLQEAKATARFELAASEE